MVVELAFYKLGVIDGTIFLYKRTDLKKRG
jgi:hypothetical protein